MTLLVLGGTRDARRFAEALHDANVELIYSIAGLMGTPNAAFEIVSGGFSRLALAGHDTDTSLAGLCRFIAARRIEAIADLTHPFAATISATAVAAAALCTIPCWRFERPVWQAQPGDDWRVVDNHDELLTTIAPFQRPFFTLGQSALHLLSRRGSHQHWLIRSAQPLPADAPAQGYDFIQATGPFALAEERQLLRDQAIDVIITKHSGGAATEAKLIAARELGLPVVMLARPTLPPATAAFSDHDAFVAYCTAHLPADRSNDYKDSFHA
ncbi:precorrin-6A/cobalt-precorrin-6A reductase [Phytohalomonas tamaricis]|uniref:precorrin-6A/cobalt-precorrin-6A reductase n=1 Tax=Phytohalomonas tamaricis TaxID=2081032 RepID=UPI000D0B668D|nr:precorrin-6A/cobalt-precorrin-6A reductase [Phytohalomonas tamaricis]